MSPTSPTFVALNDQLNKAHRRIRELEAREMELVERIRILCAVKHTDSNDEHLATTAGRQKNDSNH